MSQIILDISANTHKNDFEYIKRMLDELKAVDTGKHEIVIKHQLFEKAGNNIPLEHHIFNWSYLYAKKLGYKTTSSVFDELSLHYLLTYDVPFVKIANNRKYDWLIGEIPRKIPVYVSVYDSYGLDDYRPDVLLYCVSEYPATVKKYKENFDDIEDIHYTLCPLIGISDHTSNWRLFNKYDPEIYECHYKLDDSTGLDAGVFARTPKQLAQIL